MIDVNPSEVELGKALWEYVKAKELKQIVAALVDDKLVDVHTPIKTKPTKVQLLTPEDPRSLEVLRHSTAHVLAEAVKQLYPTAQVTIGPAIDSGFYYDFDYEPGFKDEDLEKI